MSLKLTYMRVSSDGLAVLRNLINHCGNVSVCTISHLYFESSGFCRGFNHGNVPDEE